MGRKERKKEGKMSSVKVVDILKACKQSRVDQALGLNTPRNRFGGAVKSSNMTPPWGTSAPWSSSETNSSSSSSSSNNSSSSSSNNSSSSSSSSNNSSSSSSSGAFNWNSSNAARYEQGTTFYSQVRQGK